SIFDCMVKNISDGGAKLRVASLLGVPQTFELDIKDYGEKFICETVWREQNELGVRFRRGAHRHAHADALS
ncbi:MAG: PilZ domain-containing protein, partial [Methyloligellaceae bacterium]